MMRVLNACNIYRIYKVFWILPTSLFVFRDLFWVFVLERAGLALRSLSVMSVLFLSIYAVFEGYDQAAEWFVYSMFSYLWGGSFKKSAHGWRQGLSWWIRYRFLITPIAMALLLVGFFALFDESGDESSTP